MSPQKPMDLDRQTAVMTMIAEVILAAPFGGVAGTGGYIAFAIVYDQFVLEPGRVSGARMLSSGELVGYTAILAGILSAWATVSLLVALRWKWFGLGGGMAILGGLAMGCLVGFYWGSCIVTYGFDPADGITFHPMMAASVLLVIVGCGCVARLSLAGASG